ncbi:MAG: adenylate/guanylate cyclase domain-containing protein [Magnetococcales bacterium]|nr:adenylate/guanylate cyclase domain-containing protein [Magnetococcales bacterium]
MSPLPVIRLLVGLLVLLLFVLHAFQILTLPGLDRLEKIAYDTRVRIAMSGNRDPRIVIIDIDDKSLNRLGRWPWGRDQLALLTDTLFDHYRILTLGFDVVFAERDTTSGLAVLERLASGPLQHQPGFLTELNRLRPSLDRDDRFAKSLKGRPIHLGFYFRQESGSDQPPNTGLLPEPVITLEELGRSNLSFVKATGFGANLPGLQQAAQGGGFLDNPLIDTDGVHRTLPLLREFQGKIYPSLALSLVRTILGDPPLTLGITPLANKPGELETGLHWVGLGPHHIAVDARAAVLIPYRGPPGTYPYISAVDILDQNAPLEMLTDAIVLVGSSAPGLMDLRVTPIHPVFPGVEVHANVIGGILDGAIKRHPGSSVWIELIYYTGIGVVLLLVAPRLPPAWGVYLALLLTLIILWSNAVFWKRSDFVVPLAAPLLLTLLLFLIHLQCALFALAWRDSRGSRLLARHLAPSVLEESLAGGKKMILHGEQRNVTVLTINIRGFSLLVDQMAPQELSQLLHRYLSQLTTTIHAHQGTLDHHTGDRILACWGAPLDQPHHARSALQCALELLRINDTLKDSFQAKGWPTLTISMALNTGAAQAGEVGSDFCSSYSVVGAVVSQAWRMEAASRRLGVLLVAGEGTCRALPEVLFRELDRMRVPGTREVVPIHEPIGFLDELHPDIRTEVDSYHQALALYRAQQWEEAQQRFQLLLERDPLRQIHAIYLARMQRLRAHSPHGEWG